MTDHTLPVTAALAWLLTPFVTGALVGGLSKREPADYEAGRPVGSR